MQTSRSARPQSADVRTNIMKKVQQRAIRVACGLILFSLLLHAILATYDTVRMARLKARIRSVKIGETLDRVVEIMGRPNSQGRCTMDMSTMVVHGPGFTYHRHTKWTDPLYPFRIHQCWYEGVNLHIYFETNMLVRKIQVSTNL